MTEANGNHVSKVYQEPLSRAKRNPGELSHQRARLKPVADRPAVAKRFLGRSTPPCPGVVVGRSVGSFGHRAGLI